MIYMLGENVHNAHSEFVIKGIKSSDVYIISKLFWEYSIYYPQSIHDSIPISNHDF